MEMTALTAAAAMATVMIEPENNRSRMMVSFYLELTLLQRIFFDTDKIRGAIFCRRVGASTLRKGDLFHARSPHQPRETIVSFDAARLVIKSVLLIALPGERLPGGPWPRPHRRIFDRYSVFERG